MFKRMKWWVVMGGAREEVTIVVGKGSLVLRR